jgi:formylglycine-generating enzyme required for sulfatase activity
MGRMAWTWLLLGLTAWLWAGCAEGGADCEACAEATACQEVAGGEVLAESLPGDTTPKDSQEQEAALEIAPQEAAGEEATLFPNCKAGQVQCAEGEQERYGVCVPDPERVFRVVSFMMGQDGTGDASPQHPVSLGDFSADRAEVTNRLYHACVDCGACTPPSRDGSYSGREPYYGNTQYDDYPVIYVTWEQAAAYCEGLGKRLPSEAEWEYLARGTEGRQYPWGGTAPTWQLANYNYLQGDTTSAFDQVDGATPDGLLNLAGNVWEWCHDAYQADYYAASPVGNPPGPAEGLSRVVRGGSFGSPASALAGTARYQMFAWDSFSNVGFRCVH